MSLPSQGDRTSAFVLLFATHEREIFKYILTLFPDTLAAQEIFQETSVALWEKFSEFNSGTHFPAWACRVAYFEILKYRQRLGRDKLRFDADLIEQLAQERAAESDMLDARRAALADCLEKLPAADRLMAQECYRHKGGIKEMAERTGRSVHTLYKTLERIRRVLFQCINAAVKAEW